MKKRYFFAVLIAVMVSSSSLVHAQLHEQGRSYDIVTDTDSFYLFPSVKPCFTPGRYDWAPVPVLVQEYVAADTVTVYGVAITVENVWDSLPLNDCNETYNKSYGALLINNLRQSPTSSYHYLVDLVDSVSFKRAHSRFCWFRYENSCDKQGNLHEKGIELTTPCYEFYFDTPQKINRMTDTFYVGRYYNNCYVSYYQPKEYGGEYSSSIPSTLYTSYNYVGNALGAFCLCNGYQDRKWGVFFPIIGFRCGPIKHYWLDSYTGDSAVLHWYRVEQGTLYNVRLTGSDGSDTTFVTADTTITLTPLSDSVRYNVTLRKQCHYCTSNYDTIVYGQWTPSNIAFGTAYVDTTGGGSSDTTGGGTEGIVEARGVDFVLSPNPAHGSVQVLLPDEAMGGRLTLCDLAGREVSAFEVRGPKVDIDVSALSKGAYLVKLATAKGIVSHRLLVQ